MLHVYIDICSNSPLFVQSKPHPLPQSHKTHAYLLRAVWIQSVILPLITATYVRVYRITSETHQTAGQNAPATRIAPRTWPASTWNVLIPVRVLAVWMRNVKLSITYPTACVLENSLETRLRFARPNHVRFLYCYRSGKYEQLCCWYSFFIYIFFFTLTIIFDFSRLYFFESISISCFLVELSYFFCLVMIIYSICLQS